MYKKGQFVYIFKYLIFYKHVFSPNGMVSVAHLQELCNVMYLQVLCNVMSRLRFCNFMNEIKNKLKKWIEEINRNLLSLFVINILRKIFEISFDLHTLECIFILLLVYSEIVFVD